MDEKLNRLIAEIEELMKEVESDTELAGDLFTAYEALSTALGRQQP